MSQGKKIFKKERNFRCCSIFRTNKTCSLNFIVPYVRQRKTKDGVWAKTTQNEGDSCRVWKSLLEGRGRLILT